MTLKSLSSDSNLNRILYPGATEPRPLKPSWQSEALCAPEFWKIPEARARPGLDETLADSVVFPAATFH